MVKELLENFNPEDYVAWLVLLAALIAFLTSVLSYPAIFNVATAKNIMDASDDRSSHSGKVPVLGGIGIYLSIVVSITIIGALLDTKSLLLILGGITLLFFLGLKDDILILSPRKKFTGQLLAALLLIIFTDTRIFGLSGMFGVKIMPYWLSVNFTLFVYMVIINAYNLIDGIDGLAGLLALIASLAFGFVFYEYDDVSMMVLASAVCGALLPFLYLNFSKKNKIFMGDTGAMILGFIISVFAVKFINTSERTIDSLYNLSSPVITLAILFFPLLDTLRIFLIRILIHKSSPFKADKNHVHHRFLELGFSHVKTTLLIVMFNIILIFIAFAGRHLEINQQIGILLVSGTILYTSTFIYYWLRTYFSSRATNPSGE